MSDYIITSNGELYHYGVKGMKWGVRRYRNADGTLTRAGRKQAKEEYRRDNKEAYELGKSATVYGHAAAKSMNRTIKLENKLDKQYAKDPEGVKRRTQSLSKKWKASAKTTAQLTQEYMELKAKAEDHCKRLIDKYGSEAVTPIKYKDLKVKKGQHSPSKFTTMNERTNNFIDYANAGSRTIIGSMIMKQLLHSPITLIYVPRSTSDKASIVERNTYKGNKRGEQK